MSTVFYSDCVQIIPRLVLYPAPRVGIIVDSHGVH